jgi:hypothetical protein
MKKVTKFIIKTMMDYLIHTNKETTLTQIVEHLKKDYHIDYDNIKNLAIEIILESENVYNYELTVLPDDDFKFIFTPDGDIAFNYGYATTIEEETIKNELYLDHVDSCKQEDEEVIEYSDKTKVYFRNGQYHRLDGPAITYDDGSKLWYKENKLHREDGPAIEWVNNQNFYYLDGVEYSENDYYTKVNKNIIQTNTQLEYIRDPKQILYVSPKNISPKIYTDTYLINNVEHNNNDWIVFHKDGDDEYHIYDNNLSRDKVRSKYATLLGYHMKDIRAKRLKNY